MVLQPARIQHLARGLLRPNILHHIRPEQARLRRVNSYQRLRQPDHPIHLRSSRRHHLQPLLQNQRRVQERSLRRACERRHQQDGEHRAGSHVRVRFFELHDIRVQLQHL